MSLYTEWKAGYITGKEYSAGCYYEDMRDVHIEDDVDPWEDDYEEETVWCADCIHYKVCKFADDKEGACGSYIAKEEDDE